MWLAELKQAETLAQKIGKSNRRPGAPSKSRVYADVNLIYINYDSQCSNSKNTTTKPVATLQVIWVKIKRSSSTGQDSQGTVKNLGQSSSILRINIWRYLRPLISLISCFDMIIKKGQLQKKQWKVLACVVCGNLKSAFQIASRSGSVADVQYVAHQVVILRYM
ncbi:hypothetical protein V6N13_056963 [Hibiscus sabdariffa]|uniref:ZFYVE26-like TPR repeats domain-containing protein n=1 Tax=Hibiscus sabdariffa TaxID=183260 RepID=A0ABR2D497_9ROSI